MFFYFSFVRSVVKFLGDGNKFIYVSTLGFAKKCRVFDFISKNFPILAVRPKHKVWIFKKFSIIGFDKDS